TTMIGPISVAASGDLGIPIELTAVNAGSFDGPLVLKDASTQTVYFSTTLRGDVAAPMETSVTLFDGATPIVGTSPVEFGATYQGTPVVKAFTLSNTGDTAIVLRNTPDGKPIQLSTGSDFSVLSDLPDSLAPGE